MYSARWSRVRWRRERGWGLQWVRNFVAALTDPEQPITQQAVARLPWGHVTVLLDRVGEPTARAWYVAQAAEHGWSRATLTRYIATGRHSRLGGAPNNVPTTLPPAESELAGEIVADPATWTFSPWIPAIPSGSWRIPWWPG